MPGRVVLVDQRERVLDSLDEGNTKAETARRFKVSVSSIDRWLKDRPFSLSRTILKRRLAHRGRPRLLSRMSEERLVAFVRERARRHLGCTGLDVINFARDQLQIGLKASYVSKLLKRYRITSRKVQKRTLRRVRPTYSNELAVFRREHVQPLLTRRAGASRGPLRWVMDETGLYDEATVRRTYVPHDEPSASVVAPGKPRRRDTVIIMLCEDGTKAPMAILEHTRDVRRGGQVVSKGIKVLHEQINSISDSLSSFIGN
jgi:transposase